jgi:superfamily II DNA or RNA helicase
MPRVFDNIEQQLLPVLQETLQLTDHADFCVGYFNLRGWKQLDSYIERWSGGDGHCCRLLIGMQGRPEDEIRAAMSITPGKEGIDQQTALRLKKKLAQEFRDQLAIGVPTNEDEAGLRRLAAQIKAKKVVVKLFLRHPLHAKLYLLFRPDPINPQIGYLGSSNLTFAGLCKQGELNIDVLDHDACQKLAKWFEDRWTDKWCIDISQELVEIVESSWAREELIPPYQIYIKMAYHLSQEARTGLAEFKIPRDFGQMLFEYQTAAVKIAAHHLNKRGGVLIGDVVGLGKTLMATAIARIFEDDYDLQTLILCPKNLVKMWEDYCYQYRLRAKVLSLSQVTTRLPELRRYKLVLIDESHNLRNREGKRYRAIQEYIQENESKCILLSATPYNKTYLDLSNQLRLFIPDDANVGIRPEQLLRELGETEFIRRHQCPVHTLSAFEKSEYADDWRELMRLYLVRRTRSFIKENYAQTDQANGRRFLTFADGTRSYFPDRLPRTIKFAISETSKTDQYARLYANDVIDTINSLNLPRYGLGNYVATAPHKPPTQAEAKAIQDLSRAGKRLMGFCRTNLFKRLESGGQAFLLSLERHILRNYIYLYAIENDKPLPIGTQQSEMLDGRGDKDMDSMSSSVLFEDGDDDDTTADQPQDMNLRSEDDFTKRAAEIYAQYETQYKNRFKWLRSALFISSLTKDLRIDAQSLIKIRTICGDWNASEDTKLNALWDLLTKKHQNEKVLIFTQFADTVYYLAEQLKKRGIGSLAGVTGDSDDPTGMAWRFSPESNHKRHQITPLDELRVLVATDVLSEGQNLQDCSIVVNYDLPWAIIRLVQRAGRVDRIGQRSNKIPCYSFLPAEGVERIIRLRARVRQRLHENAEVVGTDENFFEDDRNDQVVIDLYNEKAGILDGEDGTEVDLASYAYQIWKNAITADPNLQKIVPELPPVVFSTRNHIPVGANPEGVLVYLKTPDGTDALVRMDKDGKSITESQYAILKAAECAPNTPAIPRYEKHHELVKKAVQLVLEEEKSVGGQLGNHRSARFRTYERLMQYVEDVKETIFDTPQLRKAIDCLYRHPLKQSAVDTLNRQLKSGIDNQQLAELITDLWQEDRLCAIHEEEQQQNEPHIICSMGLFTQV